MNVAADIAVWRHARVATVGVRLMLLVVAGVFSALLLLLLAGVSLVTGGWISATMGVSLALHPVEYCSTGYGGSCSSLVAACMSAAFTYVTFLLLGGIGSGGGGGLRFVATHMP